MVEETRQGHIMSYTSYVVTWLCLLALTGVTVWIADLELGKFSVLGALIVASVKASLVFYIFMHLKYEDRFFRIILFVQVR